jgi:tol-pal system protein YbgF
MACTHTTLFVRAASAALLFLALPVAAIAQQGQPLPPPAGSAPPAKAKGTGTATKAPAKSESGGGSGTSEGGLGRRVDQLEEQLVDMQVVIGTLESLARSGGGTTSAAPAFRQGPQPSAGAYSSSDAARVDGLETQIRALTAQLEQLADQVRALDGRRGSSGPAVMPQANAAPPSTRFGQTTVSTSNDQIGAMINNDVAPQRQGLPPATGGDGASPKQMYEAAYGFLLQQDYGAAEAGFDDFLKRYPSDPLAANAQYWLGESFFVRGQFKPAAAAFLKGYQSYGRSSKAPDSLLKLAMSLERLGQRDAACSSYSELSSKYPNAPTHIRNRAQSERQRIGCA